MEIVLIAAVIACLIGWNASKAHMSHRGIPTRKGQLRSYRGDRQRHALWFLGMLAIVAFLLLLVSLR
jgi:hypothetical protein